MNQDLKNRYSLMTYPMDRDIHSGTMSIRDTLQVAADAGLQYVDLMDIKLDKAPEFKAAMEETGVKLWCLLQRMSFFRGDEAIIADLDRTMTMAKDLGAEFYMIIPYGLGADEVTAKEKGRAWVTEQMLRGFRIAVKMGEKYGLPVCFETTPQDDICLSGTRECRDLLDAIPGLGLVFDTANMLPHGDDPVESYEALKDRIVYIHLKDVKLFDENPNPGGYQEVTADGKFMQCALFGTGVIPVKEIYRRMLEDDHYQGNFALEYARPATDKSTVRVHTEQTERFVNYLQD